MKRLILLLIPLALASCRPKPQPIEYGQDVCVHCMMTIVDPMHGAEGVTGKGKVMKFDAIECLLRHSMQGGPEFSLELVNTQDRPGELLPAAEVSFIISEALPSPMGAYLSAFADKSKAEAYIAENGGNLYIWQQLKGSDRIPNP